MGTQKNARCIEVEVGGRSVALCLALNADRAKEVYEDHGGNGSEYGDWTEVTDGTKKTFQEKFSDAKSRAWNKRPDISGPASRFVNSKWKEGISTLGSYWKGSGVSNTAPGAKHVHDGTDNQRALVTAAPANTALLGQSMVVSTRNQPKSSDALHRESRVEAHKRNQGGIGEARVLLLTDAPTKAQPDQDETNKSDMDESTLRDNPGDKVQEGSTETVGVSQSDASGSGQNQHGVAKKKKRHEIDNLGDTSCKVYVGTRLHQGLSEKSWFLPRTRKNGLETQVRMYRCKNKSEVTVSVITEEIRCMYQKLGQQETQTNYAEYRDGGKTTTMDKVKKETNNTYTMMYTTKDWNAIIKHTDDEVADGTMIKADETSDVKIAEVRVTTATKGKRIDKKTNNRLICYTTEFLNWSRFKSLKIQGKSKEELNDDEHSRLLLLCLLIYTGWGLYTGSNETTIVSCDDIDDGETTVSVTQGENSCLLFDTNTEFTFTGTGGSSVEAVEGVEAERREEGAIGTERSEGAKQKTDNSQTVSQIVTRAVSKKAAQATSASKQANEEELSMKLRSAVKQPTQNQKAHEAHNADKKTVEVAKKKAAKAGEADKADKTAKAAKTAKADKTAKAAKDVESSDTSSDEAIAARTRSNLKLRRSARLAEKKN